MTNKKEKHGTVAKKETGKTVSKNNDKAISAIKELEERLMAEQDKYIRLYAEFDNFRKRTETEKSGIKDFVAGEVIKDLLPMMDSFEHSRQSFEKHKDNSEELHKGLLLIHKQFEDAFAKWGIKKIEAKGKQFDPQFHEAVMQQPSDQASGIVIEEIQPGFTINNKVLRPSMVIVSK